MATQKVIEFPLYVLTHESEMDVSALDLGQFKNRGEASWFTTMLDGKRHLLVFSSQARILEFATGLSLDLSELLPIEMNREDLTTTLEQLDGKVPMICLDANTDNHTTGPLSGMLADLRRS
jgi:hypothetical protein